MVNYQPNFSSQASNLPAEKHLWDFAARLVEEKKFNIEDEEIKKQLVEDLFDRLEERVNAVILSCLPPEKLEEFEKLLEAGSAQQISEFTEKNIPNLQEVMTNALASFRATYLGL